MRNVLCPHYNACLDSAARAGLDGFSCNGCQFQDTTEDQLFSTELAGAYALLVAVFNPGDYGDKWPQTWVRYFADDTWKHGEYKVCL